MLTHTAVLISDPSLSIFHIRSRFPNLCELFCCERCGMFIGKEKARRL